MDTSVFFDGPASAVWDWRVALDLFAGGIGVGAFLFAVLVNWYYAGRFRRICQTAALMAPVLVIVGLIFLMTKMGRPMALFLTFTYFAPSSPLWWGGIFQTLFLLGSGYYAVQWLTPDERAGPGDRLGWSLLPLAIVVGAYHGFLLSVVPARPLWNTGPTVVVAILGFLTTGIAAVMLVHLLRMKFAGRLAEEDHVKEFLTEMRPTRNLLGAALVLQTFTMFIWWVSLLYGPLGAQASLAAANATYGPLFWTVGIGLGLALPLAIGGYAVWKGEQIALRFEINAIWLSGVLILVGGFVIRLAVVLGGQLVSGVQTLS